MLERGEVPYLSQATFGRMDQNQDGQLSWSEVRPSKPALAAAATQSEERLKQGFDQLDLNRNGTLEGKELAAFMVSSGQNPGPMAYPKFVQSLQTMNQTPTTPAAVAAAAGAKNPVLMLPGFLMPRWSYVVFETTLKRHGYNTFYVLDAWPWFSDIREYASQAKFEAERLRKEAHAPQVELMAHSMGGLVGRTMIEDLGEEPYVNHYISFGTPHHGTVLGRLAGWYATSAAEMMPGSDFLKALNVSEGQPSSVKYTSVHAELDEIVLPHSSVDLAGATNPEVHNAFHIGIVFMREAANMALQALAK
jgi:triacylglycerol esterase/lipase EstA (alpha/beta hydrolase family)